jgi:hypothetical protein
VIAPSGEQIEIAGTLLASAARGKDEPGDVEITLRLVLAMEGVECWPR